LWVFLRIKWHALQKLDGNQTLLADDGSATNSVCAAVAGGVVIAQKCHYVFRVQAFGEPGETAQVAEERGNLSPVAFELLLKANPRHKPAALYRPRYSPFVLTHDGV
jgi:hypothetical protein